MIKSHVSKQIPPKGQVKLMTLGVTPQNATHLMIILQFNNCLDGEYKVNNLELLHTDIDAISIKKSMPYYDLPLGFNFIWLPHL